jgi:hypothetical protein
MSEGSSVRSSCSFAEPAMASLGSMNLRVRGACEGDGEEGEGEGGGGSERESESGK